MSPYRTTCYGRGLGHTRSSCWLSTLPSVARGQVGPLTFSGPRYRVARISPTPVVWFLPCLTLLPTTGRPFLLRSPGRRKSLRLRWRWRFRHSWDIWSTDGWVQQLYSRSSGLSWDLAWACWACSNWPKPATLVNPANRQQDRRATTIFCSKRRAIS